LFNTLASVADNITPTINAVAVTAGGDADDIAAISSVDVALLYNC
jgi:hypothetical protein